MLNVLWETTKISSTCSTNTVLLFCENLCGCLGFAIKVNLFPQQVIEKRYFTRDPSQVSRVCIDKPQMKLIVSVGLFKWRDSLTVPTDTPCLFRLLCRCRVSQTENVSTSKPCTMTEPQSGGGWPLCTPRKPSHSLVYFLHLTLIFCWLFFFQPNPLYLDIPCIEMNVKNVDTYISLHSFLISGHPRPANIFCSVMFSFRLQHLLMRSVVLCKQWVRTLVTKVSRMSSTRS